MPAPRHGDAGIRGKRSCQTAAWRQLVLGGPEDDSGVTGLQCEGKAYGGYSRVFRKKKKHLV